MDCSCEQVKISGKNLPENARSQADINNDVPINVSRKAEDDFFGNHHVYKLVTERCGTKALAERCSKVSTFSTKKWKENRGENQVKCN